MGLIEGAWRPQTAESRRGAIAIEIEVAGLFENGT